MSDLLTFCAAERPVNPSPSPESVRASMIRAATSPLNSPLWLAACAPAGSSGKMSPAFFPIDRMMAVGASRTSSTPFRTWGMAAAGACLTLNMSAWTVTRAPSPSDGSVCSLSDILETGGVPQRLFLSRKSCKGVLRRAARRGKLLPEPLARALAQAADSEQISSAPAG